ncbi:LOW QUALITY PROTEIN: sugar ABC transporter permease protein [Halarchaeum acidiphilum MH1-52-1]|uniref:Sugar ABC transporter permease protein n=1 Tax=Halarchaeum acidiphilum MH1-52-1 TaxID=1261545 RepID=U2YD42_9EURY|nr:LOW QUALITY PROTEIN: sugar ABC transporter permease protein [Halarchaeum acidiphilum MH1-52-1]
MREKLATLARTLFRRRRARTDGGEATANPSGGFLSDQFVSSLPYWLPAFLIMGLAVYGAIFWNFLLSLTDFQQFGNPDYGHLDLGMYAKAFGDQVFLGALQNTFALLVSFTLCCLVVGLLIAILVDQKIRYENTFRTIYLLPMALSFVVTAQFWLWMYNKQNGVVNIILGAFGLGPYEWIGNPALVLGAVVFALIWQFSGYAMVVYLAGLRAIPTEQFEAARVDGATTLRMYWRVIIPQLKGATISASVVLMVFALKAFDFLYSLSGSYYPPRSDILATMMVRQAFSVGHRAYAAAIGIMLFALALVIIAPYLAYQYREGEL